MTPKITRKSRKHTARVALSVGELSDQELAAIMAAEVPPQYNHLDVELLDSPDIERLFNEASEP
jgi:hypothetical protein